MICFVHVTILVNVNNWGMPLRIYIWDYLISLWHAMPCLCMAFLCGFAHGYLKNLIWKIVWLKPFQLLLCMMIYLIEMLIICYPSIVSISKLSCYACVSIDDHVLIWFLHRMITRNIILFEFILLVCMELWEFVILVFIVSYIYLSEIFLWVCVQCISYMLIGFPWFICWTLCAIICWFVTLIHFGQHEWLVMLLEVLTVMCSFVQFVSPWILVGLCMLIYYV